MKTVPENLICPELISGGTKLESCMCYRACWPAEASGWLRSSPVPYVSPEICLDPNYAHPDIYLDPREWPMVC